MDVLTTTCPLHLRRIGLTETNYSPEEVLDALFWIAARSEHTADYNAHIYRLLAEVDDDYA